MENNTEISDKQKQIIDKVKLLNHTLKVSSTTRINSKPSSGHSSQKQLAVDFIGDLPDLYNMYIVLQSLKPTWTVGLGILNAAKHLHVSNDDRGLRFLEIEKPDKNSFVKVITMGDKSYLKYLAIAKKEYNVTEDEKKKFVNITNFISRWIFILFSFSKKIKIF